MPNERTRIQDFMNTLRFDPKDPRGCPTYEECVAQTVRALADKEPMWSKYLEADISCLDRRYVSVRNKVWELIYKIPGEEKPLRNRKVS